MVTNPAWPGYCKVGRSAHLSTRLRHFNVASPFRDFRVHYTRYFSDYKRAEREFFTRTVGAKHRAEWLYIHPDDAAEIIRALPGGAPVAEVRNNSPL